MKYTKKIEKIGDTSITEHIVEGNYEEVLALFTELESKDVVNMFYDPRDWVSKSVEINQ